MDRGLEALVLAGAMVVLLGCEWLGFRRWGGSAGTGPAKAAVFILVLTLAGGFIGAFSWWLDIDNSFAWDLPPLGGRMLGSAGWAFALASWCALERPTAGRVRLVLAMLVIYLAPLAVALLVFHLDRLDFAKPITYPFLAVVTLLILVPAWLLVRPPAPLQADAGLDMEPPGPLTRAWLLLVGVVTAAWSVALFVSDTGPIPGVWAWPGDALTGRLISAMLMTIAVAAAMSRGSLDLATLTSRITLLYGAGLLLASLWLVTAAKPINLTYAVAFGALALGSLAVPWLDGRSRPAQADRAGAGSAG